VVPIQVQSASGAGLRVDGVNSYLYGPNVHLINGLGQKLTVGGGSPKVGYDVTVNKPSWFEDLSAKRGYFEHGHSDGYLTNYATAASGTLVLPTDRNSAAFINLTGDASIQFAVPDTQWEGLRVLRLIIRHDAGGKTLSWPSNVYWGTKTAPNYVNAAAQDFDLIELWTFNSGQTWFGTSSYSGYKYEPEISVFFVGV
jgi:hypothetical protein